MTSKQAIDILVEQTAQQAALDGVLLSDIEKRMMYFTEGPDAIEDPLQLNGEFEEVYDTEEYEKKLSRLLNRARKRLRKENPVAARQWQEAVAKLKQGDYYILVLLDRGTDPFKGQFASAVVVIVVVAILLLIRYLRS